MPVEVTYPGVYLEEMPANVHPIEGVSTSTAAIVGYTHPSKTQHYGKAVRVKTFAAYQHAFGGLSAPGQATHVPWAVKQFFDNGGTQLYVVGLRPSTKKGATARGARQDAAGEPQRIIALFKPGSPLDKLPLNILLMPGVFDKKINGAALAFAERKRAFLILDAPQQSATDAQLAQAHPPARPVADCLAEVPRSRNGALYFPWLRATDPLTEQSVEIPPSGAIAGIFARIDAKRGVWKAPAGAEAALAGTLGVVARGSVNDAQQSMLAGGADATPVNCLRAFPDQGVLVWGARTLAGDPDYAYVAVRRFALFLEQSLERGLHWVQFEPNQAPLWSAIRASVGGFLMELFRQGAFQGGTARDAFFVQCDRDTATAQDVAGGIVRIVVGFAPLKPAEFVVFSLGVLAGKGPPDQAGAARSA